MSRSLLVIDDHPLVLRSMTKFFEQRNWNVASATDGKTGIEIYERDRPNVVLLDIHMPGLNGMQVLQILLHRDPDATVIMLSGNADIPMAVEAMQLGAESFFQKPMDFTLLDATVERALEKSRLRRRDRYFAAKEIDQSEMAGLGESPMMRPILDQLPLLAAGSGPILFSGETGTGKGWFARLVHSLSPRARAPFVTINCAGLSPTFLDTELFGHTKGAFTDAKSAKQGLFEVADGGTLFLDEIGDLAPELQPKLLTVLETKRFRRLGDTREIQVDVRLLAATHRDLASEVKSGRFREDLYYRLAVLPVVLPPLRERGREAIVTLSLGVLAELRQTLGRGPTHIAPNALAALVEHSWPGNIRELRNVLERALLMAGSRTELRAEDLPADLKPDATRARPAAPFDEDLTLLEVERQHIMRVLARVGGNRAQAARALGITRATLYKRLKEYEELGAQPAQAAQAAQASQ